MLQFILNASFRTIKLYSLVAACLSIALLQLIGENSNIFYFILHVFTLGIAHGALDRWIFNLNNPFKTISKITFYGLYLGVMAVVAFVWFISPIIALLVFILYSAWLFGEVEWAHVSKTAYWPQRLYSTLWGLTLFAAMFLFNIEETAQTIYTLTSTPIGDLSLSGWSRFIVSAFWIFLSIIPFIFKWIHRKHFLIQMMNVISLILIFYLVDLAISFAVFFFYYHSLPSLTFELKSIHNSSSSPVNFSKVIGEMALLSLAPIVVALVFLLFNNEDLIQLLLPVLVIVGSAISFPHTIIYSRATKL